MMLKYLKCEMKFPSVIYCIFFPRAHVLYALLNFNRYVVITNINKGIRLHIYIYVRINFLASFTCFSIGALLNDLG